jgi:hypothetical protein
MLSKLRRMAVYRPSTAIPATHPTTIGRTRDLEGEGVGDVEGLTIDPPGSRDGQQLDCLWAVPRTCA